MDVGVKTEVRKRRFHARRTQQEEEEEEEYKGKYYSNSRTRPNEAVRVTTLLL